MAIIYMEGFDNNQIPVNTRPSSTLFKDGRHGGQSRRITSSSSALAEMATSFEPRMSATIHFAVLRVGATVLAASGSQAPNAGRLCSIGHGTLTSTRFPDVVVEVRAINTGNVGQLGVYVSGTLVYGTDEPLWPVDLWTHVGVQFSVHPTEGRVKVWINGELWYSGVGLNTGTTPLNLVGHSGYATGSGPDIHIDDFVITDDAGPAPYNDYLGDARIETLRPMSDGSASQWMGSDGNKVANWQLVDDLNSGTDHVRELATATGSRDMYGMSNPTLGDGEVPLAVDVRALAAKLESGASAELLGVLKTSEGEVLTSIVEPIYLGATYSEFASPVLTSRPGGGAWTREAIDELEAGIQIGAQSE